ncbi:MAG: SDR family oxidoreductase, partial [Crocinitomicaceae bacterium]|nr:SDR family oxidoreductase [Crocinitomicaceae bacterium]
MNNEITITVFGANGNLGSHFVNQALEARFKIKAFVRSAASYEHSNNSKVEVIEGNATNLGDVEIAVTNTDLVVSCLGNPKLVQIMYKSHDNILTAASKQTNIPKCILISSIGCGGTSWIVKQMLTLIGGKASFADYEKADKRISEEKSVPFVLVRPYALTDKEGKGKYYVSKN